MTLQTGSPVEERGLQWLDDEGPDYEIVLSTRVRLARNLQGQPFSVRCGAEAREQILEMSREALEASDVLDQASFWPMTELDPIDRAVLLERHLVSRELIGPPEGDPPQGAALVLAEDRTLGLMLNEEDHVRLQALVGGLQLERAWGEVDALDDEFGARLPYAFHHEFGFLTSCPTNVGSGLRASVLVHLPGLVLTKEINRVLDGISQVGLTFRGLYGEGSEVIGNFFQISNQTTLGKTEEDLVEHLDKIVRRVIEYEKQARAVLLREAPSVLEDKVWRAYGILRHARAISFDEMMNLLSGVRLGLTLKLLHTPRVETLNRIMIRAQTAHLARSARRRLDDSDADVFRASLVREALEADAQGRAGNDDLPIDSGDKRDDGVDGGLS
jgi:protein arginine kinase